MSGNVNQFRCTKPGNRRNLQNLQPLLCRALRFDAKAGFKEKERMKGPKNGTSIKQKCPVACIKIRRLTVIATGASPECGVGCKASLTSNVHPGGTLHHAVFTTCRIGSNGQLRRRNPINYTCDPPTMHLFRRQPFDYWKCPTSKISRLHGQSPNVLVGADSSRLRIPNGVVQQGHPRIHFGPHDGQYTSFVWLPFRNGSGTGWAKAESDCLLLL